MNFQLFNRHEIFTREDIDLVFELQDQALMNGDMMQHNYLCGLFDGYLYDSVVSLAAESPKVAELVKRITDSI